MQNKKNCQKGNTALVWDVEKSQNWYGLERIFWNEDCAMDAHTYGNERTAANQILFATQIL